MSKIMEIYLSAVIFMLTLVAFLLIGLLSSAEDKGIALLNILSAIQTSAIILIAIIILRIKRGEEV